MKFGKAIYNAILHVIVPPDGSSKRLIKMAFDFNDKYSRTYILLFVIVIYIPIKHLK